jgi:V/A-type H+-transporting ATPase subunit A
MIREIFLQQNAYHKVDTYCPLPRQYKFMKLIRQFSDLSNRAVESDVSVDSIVELPVRNRLAKAKYEENIDQELDAVGKEMAGQFESLGGKA